MQYSDDRYHLRVAINTNGCNIPPDERARLQTLLAPLGEAVQHFPASDLRLNVIYHPRSAVYYVEFKLTFPGGTLFTGERDPYLDSALQRGLRNLVRKVEASGSSPNGRATKQAERRLALEREVLAPEDSNAGPLAEVVRAGDYRAFRTALASYEEWLRQRVGRWVQRYPAAQARVAEGRFLGDLLEEVYLNAFERFTRRSPQVRLSEWLDGLIDPSLRALLRHPDQEHQNASLARTVRETPLR